MVEALAIISPPSVARWLLAPQCHAVRAFLIFNGAIVISSQSKTYTGAYIPAHDICKAFAWKLSTTVGHSPTNVRSRVIVEIDHLTSHDWFIENKHALSDSVYLANGLAALAPARISGCLPPISCTGCPVYCIHSYA